MDKTLAGLLGAVGALVAVAPAAGAAPLGWSALQASSYADLFKPIPNAVAVLHAVDAGAGETAEGSALVQTVQYYHHHHHHHHRRFYRRRYHHHHHHHHHHGPALIIR